MWDSNWNGKKAQKKAKKSIASEQIKRSIPSFKPFLT